MIGETMQEERGYRELYVFSSFFLCIKNSSKKVYYYFLMQCDVCNASNGTSKDKTGVKPWHVSRHNMEKHFQKRIFTDMFHNMNYSFETEHFWGTFHWYN